MNQFEIAQLILHKSERWSSGTYFRIYTHLTLECRVIDLLEISSSSLDQLLNSRKRKFKNLFSCLRWLLMTILTFKGLHWRKIFWDVMCQQIARRVIVTRGTVILRRNNLLRYLTLHIRYAIHRNIMTVECCYEIRTAN